ncbi:MAG: hypothetical protein AABW73_01640 [Nanoarchaeota archaeon]
MKRAGAIILLLVITISLSSMISAVFTTPVCDLDISLVNQDPAVATPGDYLKLVFKVDGISQVECGDVKLKLAPQFPIILEQGDSGERSLTSGGFVANYVDYALVPYRIIIDKDTPDGDNEIRLSYTQAGVSGEIKKFFNISVKNQVADFEVTVKDYDLTTNIITFEILNVGKSDAEALTVDIEKQESLELKGNSRNIVGSLDKNDDTTFTFEGTPHNGLIMMNIKYNDENGFRRNLDVKAKYDESLYTGRKRDEKKSPIGTIVVIILILALGSFFIIRRVRKKKQKKAF